MARGIRQPVQAGTLRYDLRADAFRAAGRVPSPVVMTEPDQPATGPHRTGLRRRGAVARLWAADAAIAVAVIAIQVGGSYAFASRHPGHPAPGIAAYLLLAVGGAALIARRRYPVGVLALTLAVAIWPGAASQAQLIWLALIVAFFTAVQARRRAAAVASLVIGYVASIWPPWLIGTRGHATAGFAVGLALGLLFLLAVAEVIRARGQRSAALEHSRQEELRRRAGEERMRIARDLHDMVAHNISVINVQANTALHLMDRQPDRARSALVTINEVSKQALVELRSVLGVLRAVDESVPRAPTPGLARLGDLADTATAAGLAVRVEESGQRSPLPADVDLAAYRIVQEALTNSARHSGGTNATVRIAYREGALMVEVDDDGARRPPGRPPGQPQGTGSGIAGMTERAAALGGTLQAGRRPGGGFTVRARLPLHGLSPDEGDR
jgi:signal transduction histidine kinase